MFVHCPWQHSLLLPDLYVHTYVSTYMQVVLLLCILSLFRANVTSLQGGGQGVGVAGTVATQGNLQQGTIGGTYISNSSLCSELHLYSKSLPQTSSGFILY